MTRTLVGAGAGAAATLPMSAVMLLFQRLGWMGQQPPARIVDAALDEAEVPATRRERTVLSVIAHLAFGAGAGALFGLVRGGRPGLGRAALEGAGFGTAVWAASYAGWVPALGIMPPPSKDRPGRPTAMVVAHWVYGATLGAAVARARR